MQLLILWFYTISGHFDTTNSITDLGQKKKKSCNIPSCVPINIREWITNGQANWVVSFFR